MSIDNTNVSITFEFLEAILAAGFNITTTRLLIAMIYMQDRQDLWRSDDLFVQAPEQAETWAFGKELRALVGPFGTNNARCLKQLINDTEGTGLFDMIVMTDGNTRIRWRFSSAVHEHMALRWLGDAFALLDIQHVAACRSMTTLELYCRMMNLRNHPIPEFANRLKSGGATTEESSVRACSRLQAWWEPRPSSASNGSAEGKGANACSFGSGTKGLRGTPTRSDPGRLMLGSSASRHPASSKSMAGNLESMQSAVRIRSR